MSRTKRVDKISRETNRYRVVTTEQYQKMEDKEKLATHMNLANGTDHDKNPMLFWKRDEVKEYTMLQAVSVRSDEEQSFRFKLDEIRIDKHYWCFKLLTVIFFPTMSESDASINIYVKHTGYKDPAKQRFLNCQGPLNNMWAMVGSMPSYISVDDVDKISLYIHLSNLDVVNVEVGQLKIYALVSCSNNNIVYANLPPFIKYFTPFQENNMQSTVMKEIEDSLLRLKKGKEKLLTSKLCDILINTKGTSAMEYHTIDTPDRMKALEISSPIHDNLYIPTAPTIPIDTGHVN